MFRVDIQAGRHTAIDDKTSAFIRYAITPDADGSFPGFSEIACIVPYGATYAALANLARQASRLHSVLHVETDLEWGKPLGHGS